MNPEESRVLKNHVLKNHVQKSHASIKRRRGPWRDVSGCGGVKCKQRATGHLDQQELHTLSLKLTTQVFHSHSPWCCCCCSLCHLCFALMSGWRWKTSEQVNKWRSKHQIYLAYHLFIPTFDPSTDTSHSQDQSSQIINSIDIRIYIYICTSMWKWMSSPSSPSSP